MHEVKGKEGLKTQFSPRRQGCFQGIYAPRNQVTLSPKLLERKYEEMGKYCDQIRVVPQDGALNGYAHHQRRLE